MSQALHCLRWAMYHRLYLQIPRKLASTLVCIEHSIDEMGQRHHRNRHVNICPSIRARSSKRTSLAHARSLGESGNQYQRTQDSTHMFHCCTIQRFHSRWGKSSNCNQHHHTQAHTNKFRSCKVHCLSNWQCKLEWNSPDHGNEGCKDKFRCHTFRLHHCNR